MSTGIRSPVDFVGYEIGMVPSRTYYPGSAGALGVLEPPDPWTGVPLSVPQTVYSRSSSGMRSCGAPYFALVQPSPADTSGVISNLASLILEVALHSAPVRLTSDDEIHYLFSCHARLANGQGIELFSLGVTPSGRVGWENTFGGGLVTPIGMIRPDGSFHRLSLRANADGSRDISIDGAVIVRDNTPTSFPIGPYLPEQAGVGTVRFMAFNGVAGKTRCEATISHVEIVSGAHPVGWLFDERSGVIVNDYEYASDGIGGPVMWRKRSSLTSDFAVQPGASDFLGNWGLTAAWYNPSLLDNFGVPIPLPWGNVPATDPVGCIEWERRTIYTPRRPVAPVYTPIPRLG
jgi:hypothetical protein